MNSGALWISIIFALWIGIGSAHAEKSVQDEAVVRRTDNLSRQTLSTLSSLNQFFNKTISVLEIKGLKRIEKEAVLEKISIREGKNLTKEVVRNDVKAIYGMEYFDEVEVHAVREGASIRLIFEIKERPVISALHFDGNEKIDTDDLIEVIQTKEWSILDINRIKADVGRIQKEYEDRGFYLTKVGYDVKKVKDDEVELTFKVSDFEKVQIKKITFLNNKIFTDDRLKAIFRGTKEGGLLSFMDSSGSFKENAFKNDLLMLTYWYLDNGYVKFRYETPVVTISDDKKWLYISIYVDEGEKYDIGKYDFEGDLLFSKEELHDELQLKEGETFRFSLRNADIQRLSEKYQDLGYAYANVVPKMDVDEERKIVDISYDIEKGELVYFGEINITGNSKTHDKVIRRELKISEGELYNGSNLRRSKENVERLGYFTAGEIVFNTKPSKLKKDVLDIEIQVKERSTGTITLGAGYGSVQGLFFQGQVSEQNLFGRGQSLTFTGQTSTQGTGGYLNLGFTDPYALDTHWSAGFDVFTVTSLIPSSHTYRKNGFDLRMGYPIFDYTRAFITYKFESINILHEEAPGLGDSDKGILSGVVTSVERDERNNRFEPTDGNFQRVSLEYGGLGGDKKFFKWQANNRIYFKVIGDLVFRNSTAYGQVLRTQPNSPVPISERFFLGGPTNMKGFKNYSISPTREVKIDGITQFRPMGADIQYYSIFEFEHPLIREAGLKWVLFYDAGNAINQNDEFAVRHDAGFGIRWFSPIGPLRFEWGFPLDRREGEDEMNFTFFIGPPF